MAQISGEKLVPLEVEAPKTAPNKLSFKNLLDLVSMIGNVFFFTVALVLTKQVYISNKRISTFEVFCIGTAVQMLIQIVYLKYHRDQFKKHPETQTKLMELR